MLRVFIRMILATTAVSCLLTLAAMLLGTMLPGEGQIAYASAQDDDLDIYLRDIARAIAVLLTDDPGNEYQPDWSSDGDSIAYVTDRHGNREIYTQQVGCPGLFALCPANARRITNNSINDYSPSWSPDGEYLLYATEWFRSTEVAIVDVQSREFHLLTDNDNQDADPDWSTDGKQIVFVSDRDEKWNADLYLMDAACLRFPEACGTRAQPLLIADNSQLLPSWSPDDRRILFTTTGAIARQMAILDLDHPDTPTPVLDDQGGDDAPSWSPDGQSIVFQSYREDQVADIYLLRLDCNGDACLRRLTHDAAFDINPRWRPFT